MTIITLRGTGQKWKVKSFSGATPLRFTKDQIPGYLFNTIPNDSVIEILSIDPIASTPRSRGVVTWRTSNAGGGSSGESAIAVTQDDGSESIAFQIPGYIEPARSAGNGITKSEGRSWYENPVVWMGAAAAIGIGLFVFNRR